MQVERLLANIVAIVYKDGLKKIICTTSQHAFKEDKINVWNL